MIVRQHFQELPPKLFLIQVANHCPKAVSTYIYLWENRDKENFVSMTKSDISSFSHPITFKSNLRLLNQEGLISYVEGDGNVSVEMVDWQDFED